MYKKDSYMYINDFTGNIDKFSGYENIFYKKSLVYQANYMGGLVDVR